MPARGVRFDEGLEEFAMNLHVVFPVKVVQRIRFHTSPWQHRTMVIMFRGQQCQVVAARRRQAVLKGHFGGQRSRPKRKTPSTSAPKRCRRLAHRRGQRGRGGKRGGVCPRGLRPKAVGEGRYRRGVGSRPPTSRPRRRGSFLLLLCRRRPRPKPRPCRRCGCVTGSSAETRVRDRETETCT